MTVITIAAAFISIFLMGYLVVALLKPELFS